jgi:DNA topoisomerase-2
MQQVRKIEDFFDTEYRDYAKYTISNRAIPSVIDGFKPSGRKIAFIGNRIFKSPTDKPLKVFQLAGRIASEAYYHHGNGSLESAIITMTQDFKNSMPVFQGVGQFGSLRSPEAGAPRYVGVKFNENFRLLYKDFELCTPRYEEGTEIEPDFFLPIIPTVLLNGGSGIAVGFATNIFNRHPLDLIDACLDVLDKKEIRELRPWINGFYGDFVRSEENKKSWTMMGQCSIKNTSTIEVTEIPPSFTYEKYEKHLESLVEKGVLSSYDDHSSDKVHYILKFPRATLAEIQKKDPSGAKISSMLKLIESDTENLTTLDENGNLKIFDSAEELVVYFVNFRLGYYEKRKTYLLNSLNKERAHLGAKARFVRAIIDGEIKVANAKKVDIIAGIEKLEIEKQNDGYEYLLTMPIHTLTAEKYEELVKKIEEVKKEIEKVMKTQPIDFYRRDLKDLRKRLEKTQAAA